MPLNPKPHSLSKPQTLHCLIKGLGFSGYCEGIGLGCGVWACVEPPLYYKLWSLGVLGFKGKRGLGLKGFGGFGLKGL